MFKKGIISILIISVVMSMSSICLAAQEGGIPTEKLIVGFTNVLTGWLELPRKIGACFVEKRVGTLLTEGLVKGTVDAVKRTTAGVMDIITFPFQPKEKPIMEPLIGLTK